MTRRAWALLLGLGSCAGAHSAAAQQPDMDFSLDDTSGGGGTADGDSMTFDVIDTGAAAKAAEKSRKEEIDLIRVVQRRPFLRRGRVEFAPFMGTNINDSLVNLFVAGGSLTYHLTEDMAIGINGAYSLGAETGLYNKVIEDYALLPQVSKVLWYGTLDFQYAPIYGKFALFNTWIIPWDLYTVLGAGYTQTELGGNPTIAAGVGTRFFMSQWLTVNFELRDNVFLEDYPGGSEVVNNMMFSAGVSFFIPPSFEYRTLK